jgi:primosomal protein N' (replication factor Y)
MHYSPAEPVLKVAVPVPVPQLFDYLPPLKEACPAPGTRVLVPFGQRRLTGVVMDHAEESALPMRRLARVVRILDDSGPLLNAEMLGLLKWCWRYYRHPPGEVVFNALPPLLRRAGTELPPAPVQYRLTDGGQERLGEGPGRAAAQWAMLQALENGPATPEALRAVRPSWRRILERVTEQGWVAAEPCQAPVPSVTGGPALTAEQSAALTAMRSEPDRFHCHLLDGVTGSGKTEVYLNLVAACIAAGRQALVLVPEIGLTPQLVKRFRDRLGMAPCVYHSGLADGERLRAWASARRGDARLLLGTRSALFLPLPKPGVLIMDESHDASFKQQEGFRFAARDVAVKRAAGLGVPIVLGSATPSLETVYNAARGRYQWHRLRRRATGAAEPRWGTIDLRGKATRAGLGEPVIAAVRDTLDKGEQVLVFLNRRGYAPVLLCHDCGWHGTCHRCDANTTWHRARRLLVCHHCGHTHAVPRFCPQCGADALQGAGQGTEQLERFLAGQFPDFPLYRFDRDATRRKGAFESLYGRVREGRPAILVGTQMLAKGHHFPRVTLVVIVSLDEALYSGDFRAVERMGQLMIQVAGRAGRVDRPGRVLLQTHHPDHPVIERLCTHGYERFALDLLEERRLAGLPPITCQAQLRSEAGSREPLQAFLQAAKDAFESRTSLIHGPFPAHMERRGGRLRWYLVVQDAQRPDLQRTLDDWLPKVRSLPATRRVRWALDVDPQDF